MAEIERGNDGTRKGNTGRVCVLRYSGKKQTKSFRCHISVAVAVLDTHRLAERLRNLEVITAQHETLKFECWALFVLIVLGGCAGCSPD